jgi:DNA-binding LytR/AlgR family response regulator
MKTKIGRPNKGHKELLFESQFNIIRLEAKINYTAFLLHTGKTHLMSYNLAVYDTYLPKVFIRINRSHMLNKNFIKSLNTESKIITMNDGSEFQISRRRWNIVSMCLA